MSHPMLRSRIPNGGRVAKEPKTGRAPSRYAWGHAVKGPDLTWLDVYEIREAAHRAAALLRDPSFAMQQLVARMSPKKTS